MKKAVIYSLSFALFSVASFGGGAFLAEKNLRQKGVGVRNVQVDNARLETEKENQLPQVEIASDAPVPVSESPVSETKNLEEPEKKESFFFAILGDTQSFDPGNSRGAFQQAVGKIKEANPALVLAPGDLLSSCDGKSGCESKLNSWKSVLGSLMPKTYAVMGNHDATGDGKAEDAWRNLFNFPTNGPAGFSELTYSFDFGNSHFVALNSDRPEEHVINKVQRDWLEGDLARNKKENTFVFFHEPAYPTSNKIEESLDLESKERNALWGILEKYKVKAVFSGHEHIHSRKKIGSVYQFGFGNTDSFNHDLPKSGMAEYAYRGNHYGLVKVEGKKITVEVHTVDGKLVNSFSFGE